MFYPLVSRCDTQPRVTVRTISLRNIHTTGGYLVGVVRCNETNPCTDINFENVRYDCFFRDFDYGIITDNVYGSVVDSKPAPQFN
jgi:hypothetical protein